MDYKIKFKYEGIGKQASAIRQRALQSQRGAERATGTSSRSANQTAGLVGSIKKLDSSIQRLIASNNKLISAGRGGGTSGGGSRGGSAGLGSMGASIPVLGAAIAGLGFAVSKINQIGNAYISLTSQQSGTVGLGGFRRGAGVYTASQMGAGMAAFATYRGEFAGSRSPTDEYRNFRRSRTRETEDGIEVTTWNERRRTRRAEAGLATAADVGALYGLSAQQTFGQAGTFERAGGNYGATAAQARGAGVTAEIPALMTGIAGILEEAIKNGINTSDMSTDIGREVAALAMQTPGRSVEAAMNIVRSFSGVQSSVGRGQMGTMEGMYTAQASRDILMERLTSTPSYAARLEAEGAISTRQRTAIAGLGADASFQDLQQAVGNAGAMSMLRRNTNETSSSQLAMGMMRNIQSTYGIGAEAFQRYSGVASQANSSLSQEQILTLWNTAAGRGAPTGTNAEQDARGAAAIKSGAAGVRSSAAGLGVARQNRRENMVLNNGARFAEASITMERAMMRLANTAIPTAEAGINAVGTITTKLAGSLTRLMERINEASTGGSFNAGTFLRGLMTSW